MIVVTVARRPLVGTVAETVLKHGAGAIHVDACRVSAGDAAYARNCSGDRGHAGTRDTEGEGSTNLHTGGGSASDIGRWPANLVLQHLEGCVQEGTREVSGTPGGSISGSTAFGQKAGWNAHNNRTTRITCATRETVAAWDCTPGCPVAALDAMSGACGAFAPVRGTEPSEAAADIYGKRQRVAGQFYGDAGGASRFFKQVKG